MAFIVAMLNFSSSNIEVKYGTLHKSALYGFLISFLVNYRFFTFTVSTPQMHQLHIAK